MSSAVENVSALRVGIVVFRSISFVKTPPLVSIPRRQRGDVEQEHVLDLALEHAALDGRADGDDLVRVDALVRLLAEQLLDLLLHGRHAGHAADEDDVVDLRGVEPRVGERLLGRADGARDRSAVISPSFARVSCRSRCFGPSAVAVTNGRLICVVIVEESSIFAFSAAS